MEGQSCCPNCGQHHTLLLLGVRRDRPQRWRPWIIRGTPLYSRALRGGRRRLRGDQSVPQAAHSGLGLLGGDLLAWRRQPPHPVAS